MSVNGKLVLAVKMLLESQQYKAELNQAVSDTQAAAAKVEGTTKGIHEAVQSAVQGQSAVVRGAAGALVSMGAVAGTAVVAAAAVGLAYHEAGKETKAYEKAIISTGNAAGVTAGQLADMARGIDSVAGTQATAAAALATMTATGQVARENLQKVSLAAVEMERATGQSIGDTAKIFESLGDAPVKASARLNESMNYLTAGTYEQIKAAEELGDKETAASIAQDAFADAARQRAAGVEQNLGLVERAWRSAGDMAKWAWDRFVDIGRAQTADQQLKALQKQIAEKEKQLATTGFGENAGGAAFGRPSTAAQDRLKADIAALGAKAAALQGEAYQASEAANAERERAAAVKASIALSDEAGKRDSALEKTRKAVAQATQQYTTAIKNEGLSTQERAQIDANYLKVVSDLTKVKERSSGARKAGQTEEEREAATIANLAGLTGDYQQKLKELESARAKGNISEEYYLELVEALIAKQPMAKQLMDAQAKATTAAEKATLELAKARDKDLASMQASTEKVRAAVTAQEEQNERLGLTKGAVAELDAAKQEMLATDLELQAIQQMDKNLDEQRYELLMQQAAAYRDLAKAKREGAAKQASIDSAAEASKAADKAVAEWQRAGERIEQSLADSLMRGFEAGKGFFKSFWDGIKNTAKSTVLKFGVQGIMTGVSGALGLGGGAANAATGGGGGLMGGIQTASNLNSLWGAGSQALYGASAGASAASLGYANLVGVAGGDAIGALATANGMWAGVATGAQAAAQSAIAANLAIEAGAAAALPAGTAAAAAGGTAAASGGIMSSIGSAVAAVPVWGWALAAVAVLGSMLSKKQTLHSGAGAIYSADQGLQEGAGIYNLNTFGMGDVREYNKEGQSLASGIATGLGATLDGLAKSFGQKAGYEVATAFADDTSKDGAWGALRISKDGKDLLNWDDTRTSRWAPREFADGEAGQKEYLAAIAKDTRQVLLDMDLPAWADTLLINIGEVADMEKLSAAVAQIGQAQAAFEAFGQYMPTFGDMADSAHSALVKASGGIAALTGNMATFVDNFYTDGEKLAVNTENVRATMAALGFEMPTTREGFKALVQAQIALGDAGAKALAGLLGVSGAFAFITAAAVDTAQTAADLEAKQTEQRDKAFRALERAVSAEQKQLQTRLDTAREVASIAGDVVSLLHDTVREMRGEVEATRLGQASAGRDFIVQALATAKASGYLPDSKKLAEAISDVRAGLDASNFANAEERNYAALVFAGQLAGLEEVAGQQLTDAQRTVRELEGHSRQLDQTLDYWRQQIDIGNGTYEGIMSVVAAVDAMRESMYQSATTKPGTVLGGGGGTTPEAGRGVVPRAAYGADEAMGSFEKFKAWYNGIRNNADPKVFMDQGYQVPDWMRIHNGADDGTDKEQFGSYLFFKNNPQYAKDLEQIYSTGRSSYATDGSTLVRSDLSKMPTDIADYYRSNRDELLASEGFGLDPVLAYQLYNFGPQQFGLDGKRQSFTEWLQTTKWTPEGLVANNNVVSYAQMGYSNYNLARWDTSSGNIVDVDGRMYTPDGKYIGNASRAQLDAIYGAGYKPTTSAGRSSLYNSQVGGGSSEEAYYGAIKANLDSAIAAGWTAQQLVDAVVSTGASMQDVATAYGISMSQLEDNLRAGGATNIPGFADGGNHLGGLRIVGERGWELEATGPSRIWNQKQLASALGSGDTSRYELLVQALMEEIKQLRAAVSTGTGYAGDVAKLLASVKNGNAFMTTAAPTF